jgi:hypothetical protein
MKYIFLYRQIVEADTLEIAYQKQKQKVSLFSVQEVVEQEDQKMLKVVGFEGK